MKIDLNNKKVLITGSSGGIGNSLCKKFLELGCKIIFTSSKLENIEKLREDFGNNNQYYLLMLELQKTIFYLE